MDSVAIAPRRSGAAEEEVGGGGLVGVPGVAPGRGSGPGIRDAGALRDRVDQGDFSFN